MKRRGHGWLTLGLLALATVNVAQAQDAMSVQVKTTQLRATPSYLGQLVTVLNYGDRVQVQENKGDWAKVAAPGGQNGWVHNSALTKKKVVMKAGDQDAKAAASGDEVALAGKGFNSQVESDYKTKNPNLNYAWVDKMEKFKVTAEAMQKFLADGGIGSKEGGQQ